MNTIYSCTMYTLVFCVHCFYMVDQYKLYFMYNAQCAILITGFQKKKEKKSRNYD